MSYYDSLLFDQSFLNFLLLLGGIFMGAIFLLFVSLILKGRKRSRLQNPRHDYYYPRYKQGK